MLSQLSVLQIAGIITIVMVVVVTIVRLGWWVTDWVTKTYDGFSAWRDKRRWEHANRRAQRKYNRHCRWQRFQLGLDPLNRHLPAAAAYTLCILSVSALTIAIFATFDQAVRGWIGAPFSRASENFLLAIAASFVTALTLSAARGRRIKFAEAVQDALAGKVATDHGVDADLIQFFPEPPLHHSMTPGTYYRAKEGSKTAVEWMVCVRQLSTSDKGRYTLEALGEQITDLEQWHAEVKTKLSKSDPNPKVPAIDWVCLMSNKGRFMAYQPYAVFREQIINRRNSSYLTLLNQTDENAMWTTTKDNVDHSKPQTAPGPSITYNDAIPGLDSFWIEQGATREEGLRDMIANKKARAMLVRNQQEGTPLGVISLTTLAEQVLFKKLADQRPVVVTARVICGTTPPGMKV